MKSIARLSAGIALAALLSFAPYAFGRSTVSVSNRSVLIRAVPGFLTLAFDQHGRNGNSNGCDNRGGSGWDGDRNSGKCQAVPEGGTILVYVLFAGVACLGAMILRSRLRVGQDQPAETTKQS